MNFMLTPVRAAESMVEFILLVIMLIIIGLSYPVILFANHQSVTPFALFIPCMTLLAIFTVFYAAYYFMFGGLLTAVAYSFGILNYPDLMDTLHLGSGHSVAFVFTAFLIVGILQKYIRENGVTPPSVFVLRKKVKMGKKKKKKVKVTPVQWKVSSSKPITWKKPPTS
jgi:hypothetical protein